MNNTPQELSIDEDNKEFNSQFEYFKMLYRIMERRNIAYESGDNLIGFFRGTMDLLSNSAAKLEAENISTKEYYEKLKTIWNKIIGNESTTNIQLKNKNTKLYEFEILEISTVINNLIFVAGIIYPKKVKRTVKEARENDY